jgi:hypothetical protein
MLPTPTRFMHVQPMTPAPLSSTILPAVQKGLRTSLELVTLITFGSAMMALYLMIH